MDHNQENLKRILEQPELTEEDQQWLLQYMHSTEQPELKQLLQEHFENRLNAGSTIQHEISGRIFQGIHDKLVVEPPVRKRSVVKMIIVRVAAAAAIVALFFISIRFLSDKGQSNKTASKIPVTPLPQQVAEVAPGTNGAILTLSDGSQILLDSLNNGALNEDKGSKILKEGNQVIYKGLKGKSEIVFNTMSTPRGKQFQLVLADGTKVWLNAASSIRFPTVFAGNERKVEVTGELYFEVAKDRSKPFKVTVNGTEIEVLGTNFNVNGYDEVIKTTLLEGSVKIVNRQSAIGSRRSVILKPGEQAVVTHDSQLTVDVAANTLAVMAWKNGRFVFEDADLETIMQQVSRWYDVDVVYQDKIPGRSFTADISRNINLTVLLKVLQASGIQFKIEGKKLLVQS